MIFLDTANTTHAPRASSRLSHALRASSALYCTRIRNRERKWLHLCSLLRWHCNLTLCTVFLLAQDYQRQVGSAAVAVVIAAVVTAAAVAAADAATVAVAVAVAVAGPAAAVAAMSSSPLPSPLTRRRRRRRRHRRRRRRRRRRRHRRRPTTIAAVVIAAARPPSHCRRRCRFPPRTYRCPGPCTCRVRARVFACVRAHCVMEASAGSKREGIFS